MAGNYPNVPTNRVAWDKDGSTLVLIDGSNTVTTLTSTDRQKLNNEADDYVVCGPSAGAGPGVGIMFPRKLDISGLFFGYTPGAGTYGLNGFQWSSDTTNFIDGTWTTFTPTTVSTGVTATVPAYRNSIWASTLNGVKAIKWNTFSSFSWPAMAAVHIYGRPSSGENLQRLEIWHPTLDQRVTGAYFDWGNVQRASSLDIPFRVKNLHATLVANGITLSLDTLTDSSPTFGGSHLIGDGSTFEASKTISVLAANSISPIYTLRRSTPSNAALGLWAARLNAVATTWT